jgi:hypothetical protein
VKSRALKLGDVVCEIIGLDPGRQAIWRFAVEVASRIKRVPGLRSGCGARCPVEDARNRNSRIFSNLIGFRSDLLEHVKIVPLAGRAHCIQHARVARGEKGTLRQNTALNRSGRIIAAFQATFAPSHDQQ